MVISESLVCGKPVIATNVGGVSELVDDSNGILIDAGDEKELSHKMNQMLNHFQNYDSALIKSLSKNKFSYSSVGKHLSTIYKKSILRK